jgi:3-oxoacyl-[acyl-carrier-protein] synthase-3
VVDIVQIAERQGAAATVGTRSAIAAVGTALPAAAVANAPIAERLGVSDHWIRKRLGVTERRVAGPAESLASLAAEAGAAALERAGVDPGAVDLLLVASSTQDDLLPNAAPIVATALGCDRAAAVDIGAACTGFVAALTLAAGQIEAGRARHALVIGADVFTRFIDPDDRRTAALFGDGAGAVVLGPASGSGGEVGHGVMRCDASQADLIRLPRASATVEMQGQETFKLAVRELTAITRRTVAEAGLELGDVELFVYHQANGRIVSAVAQALGLADERVVDCIERLGNTSAASIPLALEHALAGGRLRDGDRVLLAAIGAGFTWGAMLVEWGRP